MHISQTHLVSFSLHLILQSQPDAGYADTISHTALFLATKVAQAAAATCAVWPHINGSYGHSNEPQTTLLRFTVAKGKDGKERVRTV